MDFSTLNDRSSHQRSWFQISVKSVKPFGCTKRLRISRLPISCYVSLIMVIITSHIFTNIFQTERFQAVKFTRDYEKIISFLLVPKSQLSLKTKTKKKTSEKLDQASLKDELKISILVLILFVLPA